MARISFLIAYYLLNAVYVGSVEGILLTLPLLILCIYNIKRIKSDSITLSDMIWLMAYIFFVIGPLQSITYNRLVGGLVEGVDFNTSDLVTSTAIVLIFFLAVTLVMAVIEKRLPAKQTPVEEISFTYRSVLIIWVLNIVAFILVLLAAGGLSGLLAPRAGRISGFGDTFSFLRTAFSAVQIASCLLIGAKLTSSPKYISYVGPFFVVSLGLLALAQNPFNVSRFGLIAAWLPLVLMFVPPIRRAIVFYIACFGGMVVVMPILNVTSRFGRSVAYAWSKVDVSKDLFHLPFIDVFDTLTYSVIYLQNFGYYYGAKTLGIIFFFIPRAIWTGKESVLVIDLGNELITLQLVGTSNLSFFVGGEFYADLGLVGVALGAALMTAAIRLTIGRKRRLIAGTPLYEYIAIAAVPILMRGPMGATVGLTFVEVNCLLGLSFVLGSSSQQAPKIRREGQPTRWRAAVGKNLAPGLAPLNNSS